MFIGNKIASDGQKKYDSKTSFIQEDELKRHKVDTFRNYQSSCRSLILFGAKTEAVGYAMLEKSSENLIDGIKVERRCHS